MPLAPADPDEAPIIDYRSFTDPDGYDEMILLDDDGAVARSRGDALSPTIMSNLDSRGAGVSPP